ncbi:hypothetical protein BDZ97DRAFT_269461 [Flammula alnicola]|nr:hypothetical protein BDZ97DRAFT_269461 [Flammula alnicola]
MTTAQLNVFQTILDGKHRSLNQAIPTFTIQETDIADRDINSIFDHSRPLGISPGYSSNGQLVSLAIADDKNCRIVEFQQPKGNNRRGNANAKPAVPSQHILDGRALLQDNILCRTGGDIFAFDMGPLAMSLYADLGMRITQAVDIQSAFSAVDRKPISAITAALGDPATSGVKIMADNVRDLFMHPVYNPDDSLRNRATDLAMRAWLSQFLPGYENGETTFEKVARIDTKKLPSQRLDMIAKIANDALRLDQKKPTQTTHQVMQSTDVVSDQVRLNSTNFNNRLRGHRQVKVKVDGARGEFTVNAAMGAVSGRSGNINTDRALTDKAIMTVTSIGRDDPTTAEAQRAATVLSILQGSEKLLDESPWIQNIWFPSSDDGLLVWPEEWKIKGPLKAPAPAPSPQSGNPFRHLLLNPSQQEAVNFMLSEKDDHRITIIQGPPGTGKTSVIASFVQFAVHSFARGGIWLVAQTNVAVKNIAEKLISTGFMDWKLLVSKDFHFEWHEHLYGKIENYLIRSDEFHIASNKVNLRGTRVMLCTLSMLAHKRISKFTQEIPLKMLIVDEASQIEIGNYITVFSSFKTTLRKYL